jgi:hypothetical protein
MKANHSQLPFSKIVDMHVPNLRAYTAAQAEKVIPFENRLRRTKCMTDIVRQNPRFIMKGGTQLLPAIA